MNISVNSYFLWWTAGDGTAGHYELKGTTNILYITDKGTSRVIADSLETNNAYIINNSIDNVYVNVSDTLNVSVRNAGKVYCTGNPVIFTDTMKNPNGLILQNN
jgi:hypothetical protein